MEDNIDDFHRISYEQLIAYAAGELPTDESVDVALHVAYCAECAATVKRFQRVSALFQLNASAEPRRAVIVRAEKIFARNRRVSLPHPIALDLSLFFRVGKRFSTAAALAALALIVVLVFGQVGTVAAATQDSLPGDTLYPVKLVVENLQLAVTFDPVNKAELHLGFAEVRVKELTALAAKGLNSEIPTAAQGYSDHVGQADQLLVAARKANEPVAVAASQMERILTRSTAVLTTLLGTVPPGAASAIVRAINVSESSKSDAIELLSQTVPPPVPAANATPTPTMSLPAATPTLQAGPPITPPGQDTPPGQRVDRTPGPPISPPGQVNTPPGQAKTPPGQINTPPGQVKTPPGQVKTPPGQVKTPAGQQKTPPAQKK